MMRVAARRSGKGDASTNVLMRADAFSRLSRGPALSSFGHHVASQFLRLGLPPT